MYENVQEWVNAGLYWAAIWVSHKTRKESYALSAGKGKVSILLWSDQCLFKSLFSFKFLSLKFFSISCGLWTVLILTSSWGIRTCVTPLKSRRMTNRFCLLEEETVSGRVDKMNMLQFYWWHRIFLHWSLKWNSCVVTQLLAEIS